MRQPHTIHHSGYTAPATAEYAMQRSCAIHARARSIHYRSSWPTCAPVRHGLCVCSRNMRSADEFSQVCLRMFATRAGAPVNRHSTEFGIGRPWYLRDSKERLNFAPRTSGEALLLCRAGQRRVLRFDDYPAAVKEEETKGTYCNDDVMNTDQSRGGQS